MRMQGLRDGEAAGAGIAGYDPSFFSTPMLLLDSSVNPGGKVRRGAIEE